MSSSKFAIVGSAGLPARGGGFETLTEQLVKHLDEYQITVYCSASIYPKEEQKSYYAGARLRYVPLKPTGWQSTFYVMISLILASFRSRRVLMLGTKGAWLLPIIRLFSKTQVFLNPDGIEWKKPQNSKLKKFWYRCLEYVAIQSAGKIICDHPEIQRYVGIKYSRNAELISYGCDHVSHINYSRQDVHVFPFIEEKYAFTVGRVVPENNCELILESFEKLETYTLVYVGTWQSSIYGRSLYQRFKDCPNIYLLDPIYDPHKLNLLRSNAYLYIHGHSKGGTNISLVEAMGLGLNVLAYDVGFNRNVTNNDALYFKNCRELVSLVRLSETLFFNGNGVILQSIAQQKYSWSIVSNQYRNILEPHNPSAQEIRSISVDEAELRKVG